MNKENLIICLNKGVMKDNPAIVILFKQFEAVKSIVMFKYPAVKLLIESKGHIYAPTVM